MSNEIRIGWEQAAKAIAERGKAWSSRGDYALAMECSQLVSMLHDLKPAAAPASGAALSGDLPPLPESSWTGDNHHDFGGNPFKWTDYNMQEYARIAIAHQPPKQALKKE